MNQTESRYLLLSAGGNLFMSILGLTFAVITSSKVILLDGLFDLVYLVAGIFTIRVAYLVRQEDDDRFPYGYAHFEPLVNGVKGLLVLGVSLAALVGAVGALFSGGNQINAGYAVLYAVLAAGGCVVLALLLRRGARKGGSPLVRADAQNWVVNAAISACVVVAFGTILVIQGTRFDFLVPYADSIVVILVVSISVSVPVRIAWQALMELLNRAPSPVITEQVREIVQAGTAALPVKELFVRVIQPGRTRMVLAHVVLPKDFKADSLSNLDEVRFGTQSRLRESHLATIVDMIFTADRQWGAPLSLPTEQPQSRTKDPIS